MINNLNLNKMKDLGKTIEEKVEEKKRKVSVSYTVKQFKEMIKKFEEAKMITEEEKTTLTELHKTIVQRWIGIEMGLK